MTNQNDDLAHEIWAAAQTPPGDSIEGAVARINALLSKLRAPVADGWRLVPIEPTEAMEQAAADYLDACVKAWGLWRAMLDAAPSAPMASATVAAPNGYRLVPIEPTHAMLQALSGEWHSSKHDKARANYSAMLKATPEPSVPAVTQPQDS